MFYNLIYTHMVYINDNNLLTSVRKLRQLVEVVSDNREYFSDGFDIDVIDTCMEVVKLLSPKLKTHIRIPKRTANNLLKKRQAKKEIPQMQWYYEHNGKYIAIDNRTNDFFMEEFDTEEECFNWLEEKQWQ